MKKEAQAFAKDYDTLSDAVKALYVIKDGLRKLIEEKGGCRLFSWLEAECRNVQNMDNPITNEQALGLLDEFENGAIKEIFEAMDDWKDKKKYIFDKHVSANRTFKSWMRMRKSNNPNFGVKPTAENYNPTK